jgi:hypothetical protein
MTLRHLFAGAALAAGVLGAAAANAGTKVIGTEGSDGFIGSLFADVFADTSYQVASDGEVAFHPFGATFDTSDGLDFSLVPFVWDQAADSSWTNIGHQTWVLPASTAACGAENEPVCEPVGHFISPTPWTPDAIGTWLILEGPGGALSDRIVTFNSPLGAELKFYSDPFAVPEPATWAIMLTGLAGMGAVLRARRKAAGAVTA